MARQIQEGHLLKPRTRGSVRPVKVTSHVSYLLSGLMKLHSPLGADLISFHVCRQQTTWWVLTQSSFKTILLNEYTSIFSPILSFFSYNRRRKTRMLLFQGNYQLLFLYFSPEVTIISTAINCDVSRRIDFYLYGLPHMAE